EEGQEHERQPRGRAEGECETKRRKTTPTMRSTAGDLRFCRFLHRGILVPLGTVDNRPAIHRWVSGMVSVAPTGALGDHVIEYPAMNRWAIVTSSLWDRNRGTRAQIAMPRPVRQPTASPLR